MAVTSRDLPSMQDALPGQSSMRRSMYAFASGITLLLAALAAYTLINMAVSRINIALDDIRYGRPRTTHLESFVGHDEISGVPTHLMALNMNRQVVIIEIPGGDTSKVRAITGPYLFGADESLTPVILGLRDLDGDGTLDLLLSIRREQIVYVNKDGMFRLPTPQEQVQLNGKSQR